MNQFDLNKKGGIKVETAHIFPVIKKWLYSEKDIFLREIVSNAADAITKLRRLGSLGVREEDTEKYKSAYCMSFDLSPYQHLLEGLCQKEPNIKTFTRDSCNAIRPVSDKTKS